MMAVAGVALVALPFVAVTAIMVLESGVQEAATVWGLTLCVAGSITLGAFLIAR